MDNQEIAQRIYDTDPYGMRDDDATVEDIAEKLEDVSFCKDTIIYLLDMIDELQR